MEGGQKVSLHHFMDDQKIVSLWKRCGFGHPIAWATSYCLVPDTFWLWAFKNAFNVGTVNFANSLSSIVKKVYTGTKSSQGTSAMLGKSQGSKQPCLNRPISAIFLCCIWKKKKSLGVQVRLLGHFRLLTTLYFASLKLCWLRNILMLRLKKESYSDFFNLIYIYISYVVD